MTDIKKTDSKMDALYNLITAATTEVTAREIGQAIAPLMANAAKHEAQLTRILEMLERIGAMDNLQRQMKAGQASGLVAAPERKVGKKKPAASSGTTVKQISNAMLYFNAMWRSKPEFRAMYLGGDRNMLATAAATLKVYGDEPVESLTPEQKADYEAKFATGVRSDAERKAECKLIWKHGLTASHKNVLKTERVAWNTAQREAARAPPLGVDNSASPTPA